MDEENEQDGYQPNFTEAATSPAMPPQPPESPPTMAQQQPPPPPVPMWTSADDMRFARKSAGMNQVRDDLDAGVLHPQFAMPLLQQYQDALQGMSQEKMAFDQHQQQTATQAALGQAAMQQAVQIQNGQHAASAFPSLTARHVDEQGNVTNFYQHRPGEWKQIDRPAPDESAANLVRASDAGSSADPYAGAQASADPTAGVGTSGGDTTGEADRPIDQQPDAAAQSPFTQTIWNGTHRTDTTWQPGQTQGTSTGDWRGIPGGQPPPDPSEQQRQQADLGGFAGYARQKNPYQQYTVDRFGQRRLNPAWQHFEVNEDAKDRAHTANVRKVLNEQYTNALTHADKEVDHESADYGAAHVAALADRLRRTNPQHPMLAGLQAEVANRQAGLAAKDPASMTLPELAAAARGPKSNPQTMVKDFKSDVLKNHGDEALPEKMTVGGFDYTFPKDGNFTWKGMDPELMHQYATDAVTRLLRQDVAGQQAARAKGKQQAPQTDQGQPSAQGPIPLNKPAGQVAVSPDLKAKYDAINAAHGAEVAGAKERERKMAERASDARARYLDMAASGQ